MLWISVRLGVSFNTCTLIHWKVLVPRVEFRVLSAVKLLRLFVKNEQY